MRSTAHARLFLPLLSFSLYLLSAATPAQELFHADPNAESLTSTFASVAWTSSDCGTAEFATCRARASVANSERAYPFNIYSNASGPVEGNIVSNVTGRDGFAYFALRSGDIVRKAMTSLGGPEQISRMEAPATTAEVAAGPRYIWWLENQSGSSRLFRAPLDGGAREFVYEATSSAARDLKIDSRGRAYFIANINLILCCIDVIYQIDPDAAPGEDVKFSVKSWVDGYALDENRIFAAAREREDAPLVIHTAPLARIDASSEWQALYDAGNAGPPSIEHITQLDEYLYWHEKTPLAGGPILRMNKTGDSPVALTAPIDSVRDLVIGGTPIDRFVYFISAGSVYRIPVGSGGLARDLRADQIRLEVTQSIQDAAHTVPLVEGKRTYVRAWAGLAESSDGTTALPLTPSVVLEGRRDGRPLDGSPLRTIDWGKPLRTGSPDRTDERHQYLFELPESWTSGTVELTARVDPLDIEFETDESNNTSSRTVTFQPAQGICIDIIPVLTTEGVQSGGTREARARTFARARTLLPTDRLVWVKRGGSPKSKPWTGEPYNFYESDDVRELMFHWWLDFMFAGTPSHCGDLKTIRAAVVSGAARFGISSGAAAQIFYLQRMAGDGWALENQPPGGVSGLAHEVGHQLGQAHIGCPISGDNAPAGPDGDYPYSPCTLEDVNDHVGFDVITEKLISPFDASGMPLYQDFMSYQNDYWVSDYVYRNHFDELNRTRQPQRRGVVGTGPLLVSGFMRDDGSVTLAPAYRLEEARRQLAEGILSESTRISDEMRVVVIDADGNRAVDQQLRINTITPELKQDPGLTTFWALTDFEPDFAELRIVNSNNLVLAGQSSGISPPSISITAPQPGGRLGRQIELAWEAADPDGDVLTFRIHYSNNGGKSWLDIATTRDRRKTIDMTDLPGGDEVLFEVIATDGFRTAGDRIGPFVVDDRGPNVTIHTNDFGDGGPLLEIPYGSPLRLHGLATDAEDGFLPAQALAWNIQGPVDHSVVGDRLVMEAPAPGRYTIELTAFDSAQNVGVDTLDVIVTSFDVPRADSVDLDGRCLDAAYAKGAHALLDYVSGSPATAQIARAGNELFVCVTGLRSQQLPEWLYFHFDPNADCGSQARSDDRLLRVGKTGTIERARWDDTGQLVPDEGPIGTYAVITEGPTWQAEIRFPESLFGERTRLAFRHIADGLDPLASWPIGYASDQPSSWGELNVPPYLFADGFERIELTRSTSCSN